jgi:putative acyl-CoA dehydrogenase
MTPPRPRAARAAHEALNQPEPRATLPPWTGDAPLRALIAARAPCTAEPLAAFAAIIGRPEAQDNARMAERNPPELHQFDRTGRRIDAVALHPGRHAALSRGGARRATPPAPRPRRARCPTRSPAIRSPTPPWSI